MQCPKCDRFNKVENWICACGHLLRPDALRHELPADRLPADGAGFSDSDCTERLAPEQQVTVRFDPVQSLSEIFMGRVAPIPDPYAQVDLYSLPPLELFVFNHIDGKRGAAELGKLTALKKVELSVTLIGLLRSGAISTTQHISVETVAGEVSWTPQAKAKEAFDRFEEKVDQGDINGASLNLKKAVALEPKEEYVKRLEQHMAGLAALVDDHYRAIRLDLANHNISPALDRLKKAIGQFSHEAGLYNLMAIAQVSNGRVDLAHKALQKAVELAPENITYQANLKKLSNPHGSRETKLAE